MCPKDYSLFESNRVITSSLFVAALIKPRSIWARPILKEIEAMSYACQKFSQEYGERFLDLIKNGKLLNPLKISSSLKVSYLNSEEKIQLELRDGNEYVLLKWFPEMNRWDFCSTNTSIYQVYNFLNAIEG